MLTTKHSGRYHGNMQLQHTTKPNKTQDTARNKQTNKTHDTAQYEKLGMACTGNVNIRTTTEHVALIITSLTHTPDAYNLVCRGVVVGVRWTSAASPCSAALRLLSVKRERLRSRRRLHVWQLALQILGFHGRGRDRIGRLVGLHSAPCTC